MIHGGFWMMLNEIKYILSLMNKKQRWFLYLSIFSPLIISFFLYILSLGFRIEIIDIHLKNFLIVAWLLTIILFFILFGLFCFSLSRNSLYKLSKTKINCSVQNLIKNRLKPGMNFGYILGLVIITYYVLVTAPIFLQKYYDLYTFIIGLFLPFLFLNLFFTTLLKNLFVGLQERAFSRYLSIFSLMMIWIFYYSAHLFFKIPQNSNFLQELNKNAYWIIPMISSMFIPFLLYVYDKKTKSKYPKKEKKAWEKTIYSSTLIEELFLCYLFLLHILAISISLIIISEVPFDLKLGIVGMISLFWIIIVVVGHSPLSKLSEVFVKNMNDWNYFFEIYNGHPIKKLGSSSKQLKKISGKCIALSVNENYREKIENFSQHFLLEIDESKELIDVISLDEKKPLKNKKIVEELDEIILIGRMITILDDENLHINKNRISKAIIAYHVENKLEAISKP